MPLDRSIVAAGGWYRRYTAVLLLLLLICLSVIGVRWWRTWHFQIRVQDRQQAAVDEAFHTIEQQFEALEGELLAQARSVAEHQVVVDAMRDRASGSGAQSGEILVGFFSRLDLKDRLGIELFDPAPTLIAWKGFSMPLGDILQSPRFLEQPQTRVVTDGHDRFALAVWWPIRDRVRTLGGVRVLETVHFRPPVHNQYLNDYSIESQWQHQVDLPVRVTFGPGTPPDPGTLGTTRALQGTDGSVVAHVTINLPSPEQVVQGARTRVDDILAFWLLLTGVWILAGIWSWYRMVCVQAELTGDVAAGKMALRFLPVTVVWWALRFLLAVLGVPSRWQTGKAPLAPLFDPTHLASSMGAGLLQSIGDLLVSSLFTLGYAALFLDLAARIYRVKRRSPAVHNDKRARLEQTWRVRVFVGTATVTLVVIGLLAFLAIITRQTILDSTLDYFSRAGFVPPESERMVLIVFAALLLLIVASYIFSLGVCWIAASFIQQDNRRTFTRDDLPTALVGLFLPLVLLYTLGLDTRIPYLVGVGFVGLVFVSALLTVVNGSTGIRMTSLRGMISLVFILTVLLYPLFFRGMDVKRRSHITDAADTFEEGRDPRIVFALEQALQMASTDPDAGNEIQRMDRSTKLDSLARETLRGSLLSSLGPFDVSLTFLNTKGSPRGRYYESEQLLGSTTLNQVDSLEFDLLRAMYRESKALGTMVEQVTGRLEQDRFQYVGLTPVLNGRYIIGWVMARAEPQALLNYTDTPFPRVLLPAGVFGSVQANLSLAEFRNGVLTRSLGRDFGRYRVPDAVRRAVNLRAETWALDHQEGASYLTYYRRREIPGNPSLSGSMVSPVGTSIIAVRAPALSTFDHLYYLLRLTIVGLIIGLILYFVMLSVRRRLGLFSDVKPRFRDKVLNSFLGVGIVAVVAVGFVGQGVVSAEARGTLRSWLRQHLERVEEALVLDARGTEMTYQVLGRTHVDSLAARVGLDLNVYSGRTLVGTSRPQLVRDRLLDERLPIEAFDALYYGGQRFVETTEQIGSFTYKAGYRALLDEQGRPRYIVAVPTLPEQERLEEEEARTVAYLFGSLLLLMLMILTTASFVASALTRPVARLQSGLQAVARGRFEQTLPVTSQDELGELAETFNEMQGQLAESRRQLSQQERQLAWREMARQVAHEIKNPLTPMKLSVQHLRRAFTGDASDLTRFSGVFERVTSTLIEQIDTLARIADEFHSFARMPSRLVECLDLNRAIMEAEALMQENVAVDIETELYHDPLSVHADREELRRVFINLIKNATEAIPDDRAGRITIRTRLETDDEGKPTFAFASVEDNGTGIPEDMREKIFQPNFSTKTSGTGLGLAISRKSVEEMHGEIGFDSREHHGSTFWIRLPVARDVDS